jgi:hypothetical protein
MKWTARRIEGAWKFTTAKKLQPGAKANIAKEINKKISGE